MADIKHAQIEIKINLALVEKIQWLMKYKAAADEALSYLITNEKDAHAAKLMLNALNIGAHEQPEPDLASVPPVAGWKPSGHHRLGKDTPLVLTDTPRPWSRD